MVESQFPQDLPSGDPTSDTPGSAQEPTNATLQWRPSRDSTSSTEYICVICMTPPYIKVYPDCCSHHFCFACLLKWAEVRVTCPLCNRQFGSIIRKIRPLHAPEYCERFSFSGQRLSLRRCLRWLRRAYQRRFPDTDERLPRPELLRYQERARQARRTYVTLRNPNPYTPREAATSLQRFELYETDLWAVPRLADYREASPEFYSAHPSRTRRLIPWLTRELNALMQHNRGRVLAALDKVLWLIWNFDIRHPTFFQNLEDFLHEYTEHFVHEFYLFASSVFETMDDYDRGTEYASRLTACSGPNPVHWFRRTLRESEQAWALAARAAPVADTNDSPQPGPSSLAVSREVEITSSNYTTREVATSIERFELYERDLWAVPRLADNREASPEFYSAHPSRTRRLIPWLTRELNALMQHNRGRVLAAHDKVLWLIWNFDIRHPTFSQSLEDFFHEYTEHFVHEFYLFASSVFETMDDYDRGTEYASRLTACSGPNPVDWFRRTFRESEQACALAARAAPVADTNDSPQPGPSSLAVSREVEITSSNYTTREAATSIERFELYERDLWAVPRLADNREASPEFYSAHPSRTRRLIPWLTRELNALMQHNRGRVLAALDEVLWLIWNFDIRHPTFSQSLEDFFHEYTEHFVHEFYLFACSAFETMDDYDRGTEYASRLTACSGPNPVDWFRRTLRDSEQASALVARAAPVANANDSPQPGPSGLAASREVEITSSTHSDSDSDSSDCIVVKVRKPLRERTRDVIEILSSEEDDVSDHEHRQAPPCDRSLELSNSSWPSDYRSPLNSPASSDSFWSVENAQ